MFHAGRVDRKEDRRATVANNCVRLYGVIMLDVPGHCGPHGGTLRSKKRGRYLRITLAFLSAAH